jgi:1,4-alpha-glucan branching enzyme
MHRSPEGFFCLVLHAHLPYVRHPELEYFLEENWLYEAITETYLPLIDVLNRLADDSLRFRLTLSLSPTLIEMLNDDLLRERYKRHIGRLMELSEREAHYTKGDIHFEPVVRMYRKRFARARYVYEAVCKGDIVSAFRSLQDAGFIEIITSAATHAFLPNLSGDPQSVRAQLRTGALQYRRVFGRTAKGIWLPECGFMPGLDDHLQREGIRYFFLDTHGILCGRPEPGHGVYSPVRCPSGVAAFGRDPETARQVWSSILGYPGDLSYRDFYRDRGFDSEAVHVRDYLACYGTRTYTGLKYYRITGKTDRKEPYIIERAREVAASHAEHFIVQREKQIRRLSEMGTKRPLIVSLYDAELFGHWWFEGIEWLDFLLRDVSLRKRHIATITPSEVLSFQNEGMQSCEPSLSSWGDRGYNAVWLNSSNDYLYPHLLKAMQRMQYLADRFARAEGLQLRALNQAARELLLSQSSDWAFMIKNNTAADYATKRFERHITRFNHLCRALLNGTISEDVLSRIEKEDRIFQDMDYRVFGKEKQTANRRK